MLHERFKERGMADAVEISSLLPMQRPVSVIGEVAQMFRNQLAALGFDELPQHLVTGIDPSTRTAQLASGETLPYELFVGIPEHRAPAPLPASGLATNGWVPVDQTNLRTQFPGVYAIGDVCTGPRNVPKAGIFAESAAIVVAEDIAAAVTGGEPPGPFGGSGICYAERGGGFVGKVEGSFVHGDAPAAKRYDPALGSLRRKGAVRRHAPGALVRALSASRGAAPATDRERASRIDA